MNDPFRELVRPHLLSLKPYSSARSEFGGKADVYLDANENPFETDHNRYPDPLQRELKTKLAELHGVDAEQVFVGNGSDEAIDLLLRLVCRPGIDRITIMSPTYGMYTVGAGINDIAVRDVPLLQPGFQPDVAEVLAKADPDIDKVLFICSPNNPTGNDMDTDRVQALVEGWPGLVVVDQAYAQFSRKRPYTDLLATHPRVLVLQTLSKAYGLAGARLGVAFGHPALIRWLSSIKPPYNVSSLSQNAALAALKNQPGVDEQVTTILAQRDWLAQRLGELEAVEEVYASDTNFLLCRIPQADALYAKLVEQGIVVRNQTSKMGSGHLRLSVGREEENLRLVRAVQFSVLS